MFTSLKTATNLRLVHANARTKTANLHLWCSRKWNLDFFSKLKWKWKRFVSCKWNKNCFSSNSNRVAFWFDLINWKWFYSQVCKIYIHLPTGCSLWFHTPLENLHFCGKLETSCWDSEQWLIVPTSLHFTPLFHGDDQILTICTQTCLNQINLLPFITVTHTQKS